jgi:hypothetical protein
MKIDHSVAAALIMGVVWGELNNPPSIAARNCLHSDRARPGSDEEAARLADGAQRRASKLARRAARAARAGS